MPRRSNVPDSSALVGLLRLLPHLTLGELLEAEPRARQVTLGQLLGTAASLAGTKRSGGTGFGDEGARTRKTRAPRAASDAGTRNSEGRKAYEAKVLAAIESIKGAATAQQIMAKAGGTAMQFRAAVKRLGRKVKRTGKARGSRYQVG